jgi:hypothetical protein
VRQMLRTPVDRYSDPDRAANRESPEAVRNVLNPPAIRPPGHCQKGHGNGADGPQTRPRDRRSVDLRDRATELPSRATVEFG